MMQGSLFEHEFMWLMQKTHGLNILDMEVMKLDHPPTPASHAVQKKNSEATELVRGDLFFSESDNENSYTNALKLLVKTNCAMIFARKMGFPG
jgi:hypothetical protein